MKKIISIVAYILALSTLLYLGFWQLDRLAWKENLIAQTLSQKDKPAVTLPLTPTEFMKVVVKGRLLTDKQVHYYTVVDRPKGEFGGQGYFIITPALLNDGRVILVNRGFVPLHKMPFSDQQTHIEAEGVVRFSEKRSTFSADDDVKKRIVYVRDAKAIYAMMGIEGEAVFVDQTSAQKSPLPQSNEAVYTLRNNHLDYALTWFGLALTMLVISAIHWVKRRKK